MYVCMYFCVCVCVCVSFGDWGRLNMYDVIEEAIFQSKHVCKSMGILLARRTWVGVSS